MIVDSSVALAWFFPDETTSQSRTLLEMISRDGGDVPALWCLEVLNVLTNAERQGRISGEHSGRVLRTIPELRLTIHPDPVVGDLERLAWLVRLFNLTSYDATYLDLAFRMRKPLATFDRRLRAAASVLGVDVLPASSAI